MRVLSMSEFARFCAAHEPYCITYKASDQPAGRQQNPSVDMQFDRVRTTLCPDRITFFSGKNRMTVECVDRVVIHENAQPDDIVLEVVCHADDERKTVLFLMEKIFCK